MNNSEKKQRQIKAKKHELKLRRQKEKLQCEKRFYSFFCRAWKEVHPGERLKQSWHYEVMCDRLQKEVERIAAGKPKTKDIIFNVPPRTAKSTIVTICLIAWAWINYPQIKIVTASYDSGLATEHSIMSRGLIQGKWYQGNWGNCFLLTSDQNEKKYYRNDHGGYRIATSVDAGATGRGGIIIIYDDIISQLQAESEKSRHRINVQWHDRTMPSRLNDQEIGLRVYVMQRFHQDDPTGYLLSKPDAKKDIEHFCFPAELTDDVKPKRYRKEYIKRGGLLAPEILNREVLDKLRHNMGSYAYAGQYLQAPVPEGGGMFKRWYWCYWVPKGSDLPPVSIATPEGGYIKPEIIELPDRFDNVIDAWDLSFKGSPETSARCSGQKWGTIDNKRFLLDQTLGFYEFVKVVPEIEALKNSYSGTSAVIVEEAASGAAAISVLRNRVSGILPVKPLGSKTARAIDMSIGMSVVAQAEAGQLYIPHPSLFPWVEDFINEFANFPGTYNDQVDSTVHAIRHISTACVEIITPDNVY